MPRRLLGIFLLLLVLVLGVRAQGDVVLLTIGNDSVSSREFEYHFSRSQEKHADVFAETYGRFKQKVQCARALGLDTLDAFRQQVKMFRERAKDVSADNPLSFTKEREWIKLKLLTWPLRQSDGKEKQREGIQKMDSLYAALQNGADVQAEELPWVQTRHLLAEWQKQLKVLSQNEFSRPFFSPMGIHLIAWKEKMSGRTSGGAVADTDNLFRQKGMEDALLALALERSLDERLVCTEQGLEEYFKQHHARYGGCGSGRLCDARVFVRPGGTAGLSVLYYTGPRGRLFRLALRRSGRLSPLVRGALYRLSRGRYEPV